MNSFGEPLINFYNPPFTTPVCSKTSHYTADPFLFPLPTHHLYCPRCHSQNESLVTRLPHQNPTSSHTTTPVHTTSPDGTLS